MNLGPMMAKPTQRNGRRGQSTESPNSPTHDRSDFQNIARRQLENEQQGCRQHTQVSPPGPPFEFPSSTSSSAPSLSSSKPTASSPFQQAPSSPRRPPLTTLDLHHQDAHSASISRYPSASGFGSTHQHLVVPNNSECSSHRFNHCNYICSSQPYRHGCPHILPHTTETTPPDSPLSKTDFASLSLLSLHDAYRVNHAHLEEPDTMDEVYRQHASPRRSTNLNHLSLAPLTSRLPLSPGADPFASSSNEYPPNSSRSYLEGRSAPTTPKLLGNSPGSHRTPIHPSAAAAASLPKSNSASQLQNLIRTRRSPGGSGTGTPTRRHHHGLTMTATDQGSNDWLEHTGALLSDSAREYKGQAWLVSRDSSTSLTGLGRSDDRPDDGWNAAPELDASRRSSRSGSRNHSQASSLGGSLYGSRDMTPDERIMEGGYFAGVVFDDDPITDQELADAEAEWEAGPDFVGLDEELEASMAGRVDVEDDEAAIRRLVRNGNTGVGSWIGGMVGWPLFSVDEGDENLIEDDTSSDYVHDNDMDGDDVETVGGGDTLSRSVSFHDTEEELMPPPQTDEVGGGAGWQDASWLLTVASKVLV